MRRMSMLMTMAIGLMAAPVFAADLAPPIRAPRASRDIEQLCPAGRMPVAIVGAPARCVNEALQRATIYWQQEMERMRR